MVILFDLVSISDLNLHPCNLFQHTYMLVLPEINFLHLLLPVTLLLVGGWMTPTPSQGPPIPQGGGGLMGYDHDHGRGGGGGTRNLEHIYIYHMWWKCLEEKNWCAFWLRLVMKSSNIPVIIWYYFASSLVRRRSEPFKLEKRAGHTRWPSLSRKISCTSSTNCYILYVQFLSIVYSRES